VLSGTITSSLIRILVILCRVYG